MRFAPKISLRIQLTIAFLVVIFLSWMLSAGSAYYLIRQDYETFRQRMLASGQYTNLPPPPRFTWRDVLLGPQRVFSRGAQQPPPGQPGQPPRPGPGGRPPARFDGPPPQRPDGQPLLPGPRYRQNGGVRLQGQDSERPARTAGSPGDAFLLLSRLGIALALAGLAGAWLGRRVLRPLSALAHGARMFTAGKLGYRIPRQQEDEFGEVATTMNEMAERVARQIADLEQDGKRRQQLLADMAHELRNPVMTLRTMSGALEEGLADDPERRQRALRSMVRTSDRLFHLITDLLELAKLDLHELPLHRTEVDLHDLVTASLQARQAAAHTAGVTLHPFTGGHITVVADPNRLTQVVDNLLDNAISYAGRGAGVAITLSDGDPVTLTVVDSGQGIPAKHLPYIFDPFYRADAARASGDSHSGLGLRIARALIEAHGGTLALESVEGKGTRVTITLPRGNR